MFTWGNIHIFWAFLLVVLFIFIYIWERQKQKSLLTQFVEINLLGNLAPGLSSTKSNFKFLLISLGFSFLIITLANPLLGTKLVQGKRQGVDVVILLDISNSMKAEDIKPNRLERAKQMIMKLIDKLENDRIGIVVFAGEPFVQLPLTTDYGAAKLFTSYIETNLISTQGTAIGTAIEFAVDKFNFDAKRKKAMIIITDGENHEDDALSAAEFAAKNNFVIHVIGMGTLTGGPIPVYQGGSKTFLKDKDGSVVTTRLNPQMLEKIAVLGGGEFLMNSGLDPDLSHIIEKIAKMEKTEFETKMYSNFESQFQYPLFVAILILLLEIFITEQKNKYILLLNNFIQKNQK